MLNDILNIEGTTVLSREQQKSIEGAGPCQIYIDGSVWTGLSVSSAQSAYSKNRAKGRDARYCCASCGDRDWAEQSSISA